MRLFQGPLNGYTLNLSQPSTVPSFNIQRCASGRRTKLSGVGGARNANIEHIHPASSPACRAVASPPAWREEPAFGLRASARQPSLLRVAAKRRLVEAAGIEAGEGVFS